MNNEKACSVCGEKNPRDDAVCGYCKTNLDQIEEAHDLFAYLIKEKLR